MGCLSEASLTAEHHMFRAGTKARPCLPVTGRYSLMYWCLELTVSEIQMYTHVQGNSKVIPQHVIRANGWMELDFRQFLTLATVGINWPEFYILLTVHLRQFLLITNLTHFFSMYLFIYLFISLLHMFRATQCSSSEESIVPIPHLVCITLCRWLSGMLDRHTRQSPKQSDIYQMRYWFNWFSWWWALGCSKCVEKWNK